MFKMTRARPSITPEETGWHLSLYHQRALAVIF